MLQIKYARIAELNKMFKHNKINALKNVFFFQNVLGDIHFQLLPENFYIEIKNSSNKFYIHIQNVSLCEYYLIKEWWSYKVHVANTCHTSFLLKKMRYNERAGREKRAKKEQEDLIRGKVRFVFIPLVHTMGYTPRFHPPNGILGREKVCRVTVYCELVPPSFCFVQDSPTTRLTPMPWTRVSSFSGI